MAMEKYKISLYCPPLTFVFHVDGMAVAAAVILDHEVEAMC
jgi:hypothetical protein